MTETKREQPEKPADPNQGEGDRASARAYDADVRDYVKTGQVEPAAEHARAELDADPAAAKAAEAAAKAGPKPHHSTVEDIVEKGKHIVERVVDRVRDAVKK